MYKSVVEIAVRYGFTVGYLKKFIYVDDSGFPSIASYRPSKYSNKKTALYDVESVDQFFSNLGIHPQPFDEQEITTTQAAYILELSYDHAKKLLSDESVEPISKKSNRVPLYDRAVIEELKERRAVENKQPRPRRTPEKNNKSIPGPVCSTFNTMAQAFIRAATDIRPRLTTCGEIISSVRTDGEWGIGI